VLKKRVTSPDASLRAAEVSILLVFDTSLSQPQDLRHPDFHLPPSILLNSSYSSHFSSVPQISTPLYRCLELILTISGLLPFFHLAKAPLFVLAEAPLLIFFHRLKPHYLLSPSIGENRLLPLSLLYSSAHFSPGPLEEIFLMLHVDALNCR
jgi:hypothetical protein